MEEKTSHGKAVPHVDILFLGSPGVGKATFLSRLVHTRSDTVDDISAPLPSHTLPPANPLSFDVTLFNRPYTFHIYTSTSPLFIDAFPAEPAFTIIAYSIPDRASLQNAQHYWRKQLSLHYDHVEAAMPVMLLGLKRDLRTDKQRLSRRGPGDDEGEDDAVLGYECVIPEEGLRAAQEMRCDRYAECSAVTGELMWEVLEDITRTAARTTTENGGLSEGEACVVI